MPAAALTPKGKLLFFGRLVGLPDRLRLLLPRPLRGEALAHLKKYAVFQKVSIEDASDAVTRIGLTGVGAGGSPELPAGALGIAGEGEFSAEILSPAGSAGEVVRALEARGAVRLDDVAAEILRVEAGRPRFGQDADGSHLADEVGLGDAVSATKGCYVGQEIVARLRTYGRVNRRLVGFLFPSGALAPGTLLRRPGVAVAARVETGRVTSSADSPRFGPIGLGWAFRDVAVGDRLEADDGSAGPAIVAPLPFA
ncbi:MAG: hypothetical protein ABI592_10770 [Acidobacteriota bacterium]